MQQNSFISSIFSAVFIGCIISLFILFAISNKDLLSNIRDSKIENKSTVKNYSQNEEDEDSTFIKNFSRAYIYSKDYEGEVIERAQDSLPKSYKTGDITAKAFAVVDLDKDIVLLQKETETLFPIASITKLITAVVADNLFKENKYIEINSNILAYNGSSAHFRIGEKFTAQELLYPLLMVSSNDSAEALAQSYGRKNFIKEMNNFVNKIGAYKTYFVDPSGLSPQNVSTVSDLVIIMKWIIEHKPEIINITLLKSKEIKIHTWTNPTHFLNLSAYSGGKNGYLPEALRTSVSLWRLGKDKRLYLNVILRSENRDADTLKALDLSFK